MVGKRALPATHPSEHQHWTEPILWEETHAALESFRQRGWLPLNYKPKSLIEIAVMERYWRRQVSFLWPCK